jgi:hypothetical protein
MADFDLVETPKPSKVPVVNYKAKTQPRPSKPVSSH